MARKDKKQTAALGEEFAKFAGSVTGIAMLALMLIFPPVHQQPELQQHSAGKI